MTERLPGFPRIANLNGFRPSRARDLSPPGRRSFIKGVAAILALRPGLGFTAKALEDTLPLLESVLISLADLDKAGGSLAFDAWFRLNDRDRLVGGLLLDLHRIDPVGFSEPTLAAYVTNCPHEACKVRLESDPEILAQAADGESLPEGPVMLCPCHFSMFDLSEDGSRIAGPAWRGLYRFVLDEQDGRVIISRLERAVVQLFG
jgi:nitrite reductase/ring-hydroxylating ferredoxin subunit